MVNSLKLSSQNHKNNSLPCKTSILKKQPKFQELPAGWADPFRNGLVGKQQRVAAADELARLAHDTGLGIRQLAIDKGLLSGEEFDQLTSPEQVMRLGHTDGRPGANAGQARPLNLPES